MFGTKLGEPGGNSKKFRIQKTENAIENETVNIMCITHNLVSFGDLFQSGKAKIEA